MNWRLIFSGWQPGWAATVLLLVSVALMLSVILLTYERRLVSRSVGAVLLSLRFGVLLTLLLTLLQPVLTRSWQTDQQPRILVAVDVSESMETADRHASQAEMLRWAQALGMLGSRATESLIEQWIQALEQGQQPDWAAATDGSSAVGPEAAEARRQHIQGIFDELRSMPRFEFVRRLLQSRPGNLLDSLQEQQTVDLRAFAIEQQTLALPQLQPLLDSDRTDLVPAGTDVVNVMSSAVTDSQGQQLRGIVLFTDGRQTQPAAADIEAGRLGTLGVPVFTVPIGSQFAPRDISIASIDAPPSVFLEDTAQVRATLAASGLSGQQLNVRLQQGETVLQQQLMTVTDDQLVVDFSLPGTEVGQFEYSISTDVREGELRADNNSRDFVVSVVDNQSRVLLVDGDARWEFRYLKNALERDNRVELTTVLFQQPWLQLLNRTFLDDTLPPASELREQLAQTDVLIIGDADPANISPQQWQDIEAAVSDDGMTLVVIPGRRHMPHDFDSAALDRLLPVTSVRQRLAEQLLRSLPDSPPTAFQLKPLPVAEELAMFQLDAELSGNPLQFSDLPGHPWVYTAQPSPAATVWAQAVIDGAQLNPEDTATVIHQYYGFGQVLWLGIDSTWRWRRRAGDTWHHRFWGQLVRWAARNKSAAGNDQVRMTLSDVLIDETEGLDISVRWNPALIDALQDATIEAVVVPLQPADELKPDAQPESEVRRITLSAVTGFPERFSGRLSRLPAGAYKVQLQSHSDQLQLTEPVETEFLVQRQLSTELANISCNRDLLQTISGLSGGQMLEPWQLQQLPELLQPQTQTSSMIQEVSLWDHWALLLLFFALLMTEWVVRKLSGLP